MTLLKTLPFHPGADRSLRWTKQGGAKERDRERERGKEREIGEGERGRERERDGATREAAQAARNDSPACAACREVVSHERGTPVPRV